MPFEDISIHTEVLALSVGDVKTLQALPADADSENPIIIAPGWVEIPVIFRDLALHLAEEVQRPVIAFKNFRYGGCVDEQYNGAVKEEYRAAETLLAVVRETRIDQADVIAHSESSIYVTIAAHKEPSLFNHLIFLGPAGFTHLSHAQLFTRALKEVLHRAGSSEELDNPTRAVYETALKARELCINPVRTFREASSIAYFELGNQVKAVLDAGVHVSIVHGNDDRLIRPEDIMAYLQENAIGLDGFYSIDGEHGFPLHRPRETAELVHDILQSAASATHAG